MSAKRLFAAGILSLVVPLSVAITALAQGAMPSAGQLAATPPQLTVAGVRGTSQARTLLLTASVAQVVDLQVVPLDLTRTDGTDVLPAAAISAGLGATRIITGGVLTVPVTIDLARATAGEYSGELLIRHADGSLTVPLTARVKDGPVWPALALLAGVGLGMVVKGYRSRGKPRDEIVVRMGRVQRGMEADGDLASAFGDRIKSHLVDVGVALDAEKWQEAAAAVSAAEAIWAKWRRHRADWLDLIAYGHDLLKRLQGIGEASAYARAVRRTLIEAMRDAPEDESPTVLRNKLEAIAKQADRYETLNQAIESAAKLLNKVPQDDAETWEEAISVWTRSLDSLLPDDTAGYDALLAKVEEGREEIKKLVVSGAAMGGDTRPRFMGLPEPGRTPVGAPPSVRGWEDKGTVQAAWWKLTAFTWLTYILAWLLLAGAGFGELYVAKGTFGASAWSDYFALLAWGFGAEASRQAITEVVRGWGLGENA